MMKTEKQKTTYKLKRQHTVDCTWALMAFDKLEDADNFANTAVQQDYHDPNDSVPIQRRESYVIWKNGELEIELVDMNLEEAEQVLVEMKSKELDNDKLSPVSVNKEENIVEVKYQHVVECTHATYGFDEKYWADNFAEKAIEEGYHLPENDEPINRRRAYVIWADGEFEQEIENCKTKLDVLKGLAAYVEQTMNTEAHKEK